jgi:hypothetical protein
MKPFKLIISFLIYLSAGCINHHLVEPDNCTHNTNVQTINDPNICFDSIRCVEDNQVIYSSYFCICDSACLCFFSLTKDCDGINPKMECLKVGGGLYIFSGEFCLVDQDNRFSMLELMDQEIRKFLE